MALGTEILKILAGWAALLAPLWVLGPFGRWAWIGFILIVTLLTAVWQFPEAEWWLRWLGLVLLGFWGWWGWGPNRRLWRGPRSAEPSPEPPELPEPD